MFQRSSCCRYVIKELVHVFSCVFTVLWMHLGSLESTQESRVTLGCASNNSYAFFALYKLPLCIHSLLYNNASSSRILIGFRLFSIRGQTYDWRHHFKVFPSVFKVAEGFKNLRYYFTWRGKDKVQKSLVEALNRYESVGEERKSRFFVTNWLREKILEQSQSTVERD